VRSDEENRDTQASPNSEMHKQDAVESNGAHPDPFPNQRQLYSNPASLPGRPLGQPEHDVDSQVSSDIMWAAKVSRKKIIKRGVIEALRI